MASKKLIAFLFAAGLAGGVTAQNPQAQPVEAEIKPYNGAPTLFLDSTPDSGMMAAGFNIANQMIFAKMGVKIFMPTTTASQGFWAEPVSLSADVWNYDEVNKRLKTICEGPERRMVIIRLEMSAPTWWREKYPAELVHVVGSNGTEIPLELPLEGHPSRIHGARTVPSWASKQWRQDTADAIARLIREIEGGPYASSVIGYMICSGDTHEWFEWGSKVDVSLPNREGFRRWLRNRYSAESALRETWNTDVSFETARPPAEKDVNESRWNDLRDPTREQAVIDYLLYLSERTGEAVEMLCAQVKKSSSRKVLAGAFYGYISNSDPRWGHQDLDRILRSPDVDWLSSPTLYWEHRQLGVAAPGPMVPLGSLTLHGKYWISETDLRTSLTGDTAGWFQAKVSKIDEDIVFQRREMAWIFTAGLGQWWFDVSNIRYDHPDLIRELGHLVEVSKRCLSLSRASEEKAVAIVDAPSALYLKPSSPILEQSRRLQIDQLTRSGLASRAYSSADLDALAARRMFLFCDLIAPSEALRQSVDRLKSGKRVLVFNGAAGAFTSRAPSSLAKELPVSGPPASGEAGEVVPTNALSLAAMEQLTGIRLRRLETPADLNITLGDCGGLAPGLKGRSFGARKAADPVFVADDPDVEVWGTLDSGEPGLVVKRFPDWISVYSSAPLIPAGVLAAIGALAGVHSYLPAGDAVWASRDLLGVSAFTEGVKRLSFEKPVHLIELYEGKDLGRGVSFDIPFSKFQTQLFSKEEKGR